MTNQLTADEEQKLHLFNYAQLLLQARKLSLPISVNSTSIYFYKKLITETSIISFNQPLLIKSIILLAIKSENIHPHQFISTIKIDDRKIIYQYENDIAQYLKFSFHIPSPYLRILGQLIILQEKVKIIVHGVLNTTETIELNENVFYEQELENQANPFIVNDVNMLWKASAQNMDKILMVVDEKIDVNICALAALDLPTRLFDNNYDLDKINNLRNKIKEIKLPDDEEIKNILKKIEKIKAL
ncbi:hypothetical protein GVAV_000055 [Gurleya vavrai]